MKSKICVPTSIESSLQKFFDDEKITIAIVIAPPCDVKVIQCDDRKENSLGTIYSGGWITCEMARAIAKKLEIPLCQMGKMLDHLDVKIRKCSLGCFK